MMRLTDKVAIVTGGASGIGLAIVEAYLNEGAIVYAADIDLEKGASVTSRLGPRARAVRLDATDEGGWTLVIDEILQACGRLDIVVNNAGVTGTGDVAHDPETTALKDWQRVIHINLDSVFLGCKHAIRAMRRTGSGSIINMSSRSGLVGVPHAAAYAASKAAIRNHSKSVALYCAEQNLDIRCNTIFPASIRTPMWEAMLKHSGQESQMLAEMPLHRFGRPEEVAAIAVLLGSDEATYVTGSEFNIDGGVLAGSAASPK